MSHSVQRLLFAFFTIALLYLMYYIVFLQGKPVVKLPSTTSSVTKSADRTTKKTEENKKIKETKQTPEINKTKETKEKKPDLTMKRLTECITSSKCSSSECQRFPLSCLRPENRIHGGAKDDFGHDHRDNSKKPYVGFTGEDLRKSIQIQIERNRRAFQEAFQKHKNKHISPHLEKINIEFLKYGFRYVFSNFYLYLPIIAFGLSMGVLGIAMSLKILGMFVIAVIVSAAITQETIIGHYNYIGPYIMLFGGVAVVLYDEQKTYAIPLLGGLIGMFFGFLVASDGPLAQKWVFVTGALFAAAFITLVSSLCAKLFDKKWLDNVMSLLGGSLIAIALVLFAIEVNTRG